LRNTWTYGDGRTGPGTNPHYYQTWKIKPNLHSLKQQVIGNIDSVLWVVMATVGLVMLIACTNVANLLQVRAESRQHELWSRHRSWCFSRIDAVDEIAALWHQSARSCHPSSGASHPDSSRHARQDMPARRAASVNPVDALRAE